ncbi:MAG: hypothetical protein AAF692_09090, partial [Pseudomonadota bacterium]
MSAFGADRTITYAATQTEAGRGGIARVSRLSVRALQNANRPVVVRSLLDTASTVIDGVPAHAA